MSLEPVQSTRTAVYVRVSSVGQNYAMQRSAIEQAYPEATQAEWYQEKLSAKTTQRPELQRMLEDARAGRFDKLVVFKMDRLTRSGVADTFAVVSELRNSGVTLVSVADRLRIRPDKDIVSDCYIFALGLAAELEHTAIKERIAAAIARKRAKGQGWGRPKKATASMLSRVRTMKAQGMTIVAIAKALRVSRSTVHRLLASAK